MLEEVKGHLWDYILSFHRGDPRDKTQVKSKRLYLISHLAGSHTSSNWIVTQTWTNPLSLPTTWTALKAREFQAQEETWVTLPQREGIRVCGRALLRPVLCYPLWGNLIHLPYRDWLCIFWGRSGLFLSHERHDLCKWCFPFSLDCWSPQSWMCDTHLVRSWYHWRLRSVPTLFLSSLLLTCLKPDALDLF